MTTEHVLVRELEKLADDMHAAALELALDLDGIRGSHVLERHENKLRDILEAHAALVSRVAHPAGKALGRPA